MAPYTGPKIMPLKLTLLALLLVSQAAASELTYRSSPEQGTVLELYTSEGCSSCPPADRWFSGLVNHSTLWEGLYPLSFHVDYWDYLGWPDRLASPEAGDRQRRYRRQGSVNGVYTPGVLATGEEWRSWRRNPSQLPASGRRVGVLELTTEGDAFEASFSPADEAVKPLVLHVAILGFGMKTKVRAGENKGRELRHDFVVLGHSVFADGEQRWRGKLPQAPLADEAERLAVVAWISAADRLGPIQAAGGWR